MTDSTRRSGRATKGQHSKLNEPEDVPAPPKRGGKGNKAKKNEPTPPPEEEENAIIRCICGYVEEDEDDDRKMICCEKCDAWQHNECMEMSENDAELPEEYYCEQCRPKDHKSLLAKIARGEKPWEERAKQRDLEEQEKKGRKRGKGKKGKKGRPSEVPKPETHENGAMDVDPVPALEEQLTKIGEPPQEEKAETSKRKLPEEISQEPQSPSQIEPPSKSRKLTSPTTEKRKITSPVTEKRNVTSPIVEKPTLPPPTRRKSSASAPNKWESAGTAAQQGQLELVEQIDDLQSEDRRKIATALVRMFTEQTKLAQKQGAFALPEGQKSDEFGLRLGLLVEQAVYLNFWSSTGKPTEAYRDKFRAINHNVKANSSLRDNLLNGSLKPNDLSKMSRDDMASKELQEKKEEMLKESEKQHMLVQEEGPRMRRTHKGEELIEDESHIADGTDSAFVAPVRKRASEIDTNIPKQASPEGETPHSPAAVELPDSFGAKSPPSAQPLVVDTSAPPRVTAAPERKPANNFNINDVWSGVKGPDPEVQRTRQAPRPSEPVQQPQGSGVQADAEIDQLLKDEEPEDDEPYSPVDYTAEPGSTIWHGKLAMAGIANFNGSGRHVAGADLSPTLPWHTLIPSSLLIEGRIAVGRASEYLCSLKWSTTTDVVVVAVTPNEDSESQAQFDKLFRYFTERDRYGVIGKSQVPSVKDTYVVPLEAGMTQKPEFVELLEYCIIEEPTPERMLLLTFAVKSNNSPSAQQTPRHHIDASSMASPIGVSVAPGVNSIGQHPGFQNSPTTYPPPQQHLPYAGSPTQVQHAYMPPHIQEHQSPYPPQQQPTGMDAARQALGDLANAATVTELVNHAPDTGLHQFTIIREILQNEPIARDDFSMLMTLLQSKLQGTGPGNQSVQ